MERGRWFCLLRLIQKTRPAIMMPNPAAPPMTLPTIVPVSAGEPPLIVSDSAGNEGVTMLSMRQYKQNNKIHIPFSAYTVGIVVTTVSVRPLVTMTVDFVI